MQKPIFAPEPVQSNYTPLIIIVALVALAALVISRTIVPQAPAQVAAAAENTPTPPPPFDPAKISFTLEEAQNVPTYAILLAALAARGDISMDAAHDLADANFYRPRDRRIFLVGWRAGHPVLACGGW